MENNLYKTPEADLIETQQIDEQKPMFYIVSLPKFAALYICTVGLYSLVWFYINWRNYKSATNSEMWPIPRAIFAIFFTHSLFSKVDEALEKQKTSYEWPSALLATSFVVLSIVSSVADRIASKQEYFSWLDAISLVALPITMFILMKAQKAINICEKDPSGASNAKFTAVNIIWMVIGVAYWLFIALGFLVIFGVIE